MPPAPGGSAGARRGRRCLPGSTTRRDCRGVRRRRGEAAPATPLKELAGFYVRLAQLNGHDGAWFAQRAREFKSKGQTRNAWLYYREAIALSVPVDFMSTLVTDKLYDELQAAQPSDLPVNGNTVDLAAAGKSYRLSEVFPLVVGSDLDVVVKYQAADVSDTAATFKENQVVTKALIAKFPEFRDAFAGVVVRAVEPSGRDYGSLTAMKPRLKAPPPLRSGAFATTAAGRQAWPTRCARAMRAT